jgi:hypothetical protein
MKPLAVELLQHSGADQMHAEMRGSRTKIEAPEAWITPGWSWTGLITDQEVMPRNSLAKPGPRDMQPVRLAGG